MYHKSGWKGIIFFPLHSALMKINHNGVTEVPQICVSLGIEEGQEGFFF